MALILFNPAPRSGKGDRLPGGGRAWAATPAAWRQGPLHHASYGPPPPLRFTARVRINNTVLATRSCARALPTTKPIDSPPAPRGRRSAERRMPTMCRAASANVAVCRCVGRGCAPRRQVYAVCALICLRGAPAFRRFDRGSPRDSHPDSAPGHASWIENQAGVIRSIASQCSGSTPRLGRSTEGNDAQSRSGAGCEPARKHRTRSNIADRIRNASLDERDAQTCI
jgi:hypothetical protein